VFAAANRLPEAVYAPSWVAMQLGSLGGALGVAAAAHASGRPGLAGRLAVWSTASWAAAKVVKPFVRRGRPAAALGAARVLGREQRGLGYPSGHAAVAATLASVAGPELPLRWRGLAWSAVAGVSVSRMYVGAHLPLDVAGGLALGVGMGALSRMAGPPQMSTLTPSRSRSPWRSSRRE
jgi:glycosyltransferase 2 family protein